jgi:hypothetical protein
LLRGLWKIKSESYHPEKSSQIYPAALFVRTAWMQSAGGISRALNLRFLINLNVMENKNSQLKDG